MDENDMDETAFVTHCGLYRYKNMLFGIQNALATFRRAMDVILETITWQYALSYVNDVIKFLSTQEERIQHV